MSFFRSSSSSGGAFRPKYSSTSFRTPENAPSSDCSWSQTPAPHSARRRLDCGMSHQTVGHAEDKKSRAYRNLPAFPARGMDVVTLYRRPHLSHHHGTSALCEVILFPLSDIRQGEMIGAVLSFRENGSFFTFRFPAFSLPVRGAPALSSLLRFPVFLRFPSLCSFLSLTSPVPLRFPVFYVSRPFALSCLLRFPPPCVPFPFACFAYII